MGYSFEITTSLDKNRELLASFAFHGVKSEKKSTFTATPAVCLVLCVWYYVSGIM